MARKDRTDQGMGMAEMKKVVVVGAGKTGRGFIGRLSAESKTSGNTIPWYIMTSKENHNETSEFLENNNYFGYDKNKILIKSIDN